MQELTEDSRAYAAPLLSPLRAYLSSVCAGVLGAPIKSDAADDETLIRFIGTDASLLYVEKTSDEEALKIYNSVKPSSRTLSSVSFVKIRDAPLDTKTTVSMQLQVMSMGAGKDLGENGVSLYSLMQQYARHSFAPLVRIAGSNIQTSADTNEAAEHLSVLNRRIRELDLALEQCQRGSVIPKVVLQIPPSIEKVAPKTTAAIVKGLVEKYNPSQADALFDELHLTAAMGKTTEQNEAFANEISKYSKMWPADIERQSKFIDTPFPSTAEREVLFWKDLEKKLLTTKEQLGSTGVLLTKLMLKRTNRVSEQLIREAELELEKALEVTQASVSFFSDFKIEELMSAADLLQVAKAVTNILQYFARIRHSKYDFSRVIRLLEVFGVALFEKMVSLLKDKGVLRCGLDEFKAITSNCDLVFAAWETHFGTLKNILKDVAKRRTEKIKSITFDHELLQRRLKAITDFRDQHDRLLTVFSSVLAGEENTVLTELSEAYKLMLRDGVDPLDVSNDGQSTWSVSIQMYEKRLAKTEERITRTLEDRLTNAHTADEMFHIFAVFSPLFFRPLIRNAVNSFRSTLVKNVREDVKRLQEKFKLRYDDSQEKVTADLRDIPPLSGRIIWARQIESQLGTLMKRMEDVLGADGWESYQEGKQLREVCDELRSYLDVDQLYKDWLTVQMKTESTLKYSKASDFVLLVEDDQRSVKVLKVNFDPKQIVLFKEVRYLEWLLPEMKSVKTIPATIKTLANEAYARFPISMALEAALSGFAHAKQGVTPRNLPLLAAHLVAVRDSIKEAIGGSKQSKKWIKWDSADLNEWVGRVSHKVYAFQERVDDICDKLEAVDSYLLQLQTCAFEREAFEQVMSNLQTVIDDTRMRGYANVQTWVSDLDERIEQIILDRIKRGINAWIQAFRGTPPISDMEHPDAVRLEDMVSLPMTLHEVLISNQRIFVSPPLEESRVEFITNYHSHISVICTLPRIVSSRYEVFADAKDGPNDYSSLLAGLPTDISHLPYLEIEQHMNTAKAFLKEWMQYQALWDLPLTALAESAGQDFAKWQRLLAEMKASRSTLDRADEETVFGAIVINHRQVQGKIESKYDMWQKEAQLQFGGILGHEIKAMSAEMSEIKTVLENAHLDGNSKDVIDGVRALLKLKTKLGPYKVSCANFEASEKLLQKQRFKFPAGWIAAGNLTNSLSDLQTIFSRRSSFLDAEMPNLVGRVQEESKAMSKRVSVMLESWEKDKPSAGQYTPEEALRIIATFSVQADKLKKEEEEMAATRLALHIESAVDERSKILSDELHELKESWNSLGSGMSKLQKIREQRFREIDPVRVRKQLDELVEELRLLPAKVRNNASYETLQKQIQIYLGQQLTLRDLKSEALQDRHVRAILKHLAISVDTVAELTLGMLWDSKMAENHAFIMDTLSGAQGEYALDMYIAKIKEYWITAELSIATRDNIGIVTEWDKLFNTIEDDLSSLASMKHSPYFATVKQFQEESATWESKITALRAIFSVWVEVQRKWLYLRGIFRNEDIKIQLPSQFSTFKTVDNEQVTLMKKVSSQPSCLGLLLYENLAKQLERCDATMVLIQKSLIDYLDAQREIFPRYYFVNNNDLVEIIGNSNEPSKIISHLGEMFAGVVSVDLSTARVPNKNSVDKMSSKEGEFITLINAVDVGVTPTQWLSALEKEIISTLAVLMQKCMANLPSSDADLIKWVDGFPAQIGILASQVTWCASIEKSLNSSSLATVQTSAENRLKALSESILGNLSVSLRKKCEQLITEVVHQRDVTRLLIATNVASSTSFGWRYHLRIYWNDSESVLTKKLSLKMSNASFFYGFEYQGICERLVQTPLTDRCYLTLTQALHLRLGGCPFGPAGTGKTESVKMLGSQLGRLVLVFNCDENFDYASMGRIFAGLCRVGAWGCFDEFNRLEARILSAVSQQILNIQNGLINKSDHVELMGNNYKLSPDVGVFITMNPGYAGRSELPDNLKQLFRAVAMAVPDLKLITQVMLYSQGIITAEALAGKTVLLFTLCAEQLSSQSHYDFGLRALKSVLTGAGELKRISIASKSAKSMNDLEMEVLVRSLCNSIVPKLVSQDVQLFTSLFQSVFPGLNLPSVLDAEALNAALKHECEEDSFEFSGAWADKVLQLKQVLDVRHGVMLVGPSGTGKTSAWRSLIKAMTKVDKIKGDFYVIDPKAISKSRLYGTLDPNTLEWVDGIFTKLLRKFIDAAAAGNTSRRSWIVFDGDVDPEWAENLNSVLDDNKVLTLPTGDRLKIPDNVRIIFEVDTLKYATLATVSRCGMIWFPDGVISIGVSMKRQLKVLRKYSPASARSAKAAQVASVVSKFVDKLKDKFVEGSIVASAIEYSLAHTHIMTTTLERLMSTLHSFLCRGIDVILEYNDFNAPMSDAHFANFTGNWLLYSLQWACGSSMDNKARLELSKMISGSANFGGLTGGTLLDMRVSEKDGNFATWSSLVQNVDLPANKVSTGDVVIPTTDTTRHEAVLTAWINSRKPLILCGPPGSGKTMTLTAVIQNMPSVIVAQLDFSSSTTPDLILKVFAQYCEVVDSPEGLTLQPNSQSYSEEKWLLVFCDEINLPETDKYGTQKVIMFIRQLTEQGGFWNNDCKWIILKRIQFIGACNPPTDTGRVALTNRFLRHSSVLLVDYPAEESLKQIYRTFNTTILKNFAALKTKVEALTNAMVEVYTANHDQFKPEAAPQYIYSPRELSRWVRALYEAVTLSDASKLTYEELIRLWASIGYHLFQDRLVTDAERKWCDSKIQEIAVKHFKGADITKAVAKPIMYTDWISGNYQSCKIDDIRVYISGKLKVFYEEVMDVPLVLFDDLIEHVIRIDYVLKNPLGHLLLAGESGVGKTVLSRFVAWLNGLSVFQIKASSRYTIQQFDEDLRSIFRRVGIEGEKICFIFDESNALSSAFLERMNALLASGEVPGLFEGDDRAQLLSACRDSFVQRDGLILNSDDEIWRQFVKCIQRNLHVVFTMNPANTDFNNRSSTSPALFNRCVVDWFGTWSAITLAQVAFQFIANLDKSLPYKIPAQNSAYKAVVTMVNANEGAGVREGVVSMFIDIYNGARNMSNLLGKSSGRKHYVSPRDYLDMVNKFNSVVKEKSELLNSQQKHIKNGLKKLLETQNQVADMRVEMERYTVKLKEKDVEANVKLNEVVERQKEATVSKEAAEKLAAYLAKQTAEINKRSAEVQKQLDVAGPALAAAKEGVKNIKKADFNEIKSLSSPPTIVRLVMELVIVLMGERQKDWNNIKKVIRGEDFLNSILNFDPYVLTAAVIGEIEADYLSNADLSQEAVNRGSKACAPLYMWALSQVSYSKLLIKLKPLFDEIEALKAEAAQAVAKHNAALEDVDKLEKAIDTYKADYSGAIREHGKVKTDMEKTSQKTTRAESLLASLLDEKARWSATSSSFDAEMATLVGDAILSAAFLTFGGIFDQATRAKQMKEWMKSLSEHNFEYKKAFDPVNYLASASNIVQWSSYGLSNDVVSLQNAVLLERFTRYPLIVDPSGQATAFILQKYAERKIANTSFLEPGFLKILSTAVRFGTPVLVRDVEFFDPILNPILNKEVQKSGGRALVRIGSDEIDFSPRFSVILVTRDPLAHFPPDLCSRVTMVNFTVTSSSLNSQTISSLLKSERPDIEAKRSAVIKLMFEQQGRLRELEESILSRIGDLKGAILDDDSFLTHLEDTKKQAIQITEDVKNSDHVMAEIDSVCKEYESTAFVMTSTYFSLSGLADVNVLYQFSLEFFFEIIDKVLSSASTGTGERKSNLQLNFVKEISTRVMKSLKYEDQMLVALKLALLCLQGDKEKRLDADETHVLYLGLPAASAAGASSDLKHFLADKFKGAFPGKVITDALARGLQALSSLPVFSNLSKSVTDKKGWDTFFESQHPENDIPASWKTDGATLSKEKEALLKLLIVRCLYPAKIVSSVDALINLSFGGALRWRENSVPNLKRIAVQETKPTSPILLCCGTGQDASSKVDALAKELGKTILSVAMGSKEGFEEADKSIAAAAKSGYWVLLRNIHLCGEWLVSLEKRLQAMRFNPDFRLFLTSDISDNLPTELVRRSDLTLFEASTGVKSNLYRFFHGIPAAKIDRKPVERIRLYGLLGWLNAVVQERLRYAPLGWSKKYEFSDADALYSLEIIDQWLDELVASKVAVSATSLPWEALRVSLSQSFYGGRIDNKFDQAALDSFIDFIFNSTMFDSAAPLALDYSAKGKGGPLVKLPNGLSKENLEEWINKLPDVASPDWLGLPSAAENQLQSHLGQTVLSNLLKLDQIALSTTSVDESDSIGSSVSLTQLSTAINGWKTLLPKIASLPMVNPENVSDVSMTSMERCLAREVSIGTKILKTVTADLDLILDFAAGKIRSTNHIRDMISCYNKSTIPKEWISGFTTSPSVPLGQWVVELSKRTSYFEKYKEILSKRSNKCIFWAGGMFAPESFITATRQMAAQANKWSLEDVELHLEIASGTSEGVQDYVVDGLIVVSASWSGTALQLDEELTSVLPTSRFRWKLKSEGAKQETVLLPVYLDETRKLKVTEVLVRPPAHVPKQVWSQRGVAILLKST